MVKEVGEVFERLFEHFHARQVHDAEVIGSAQLKPPPRVIRIFFSCSRSRANCSSSVMLNFLTSILGKM